ncbi:MAG: glycerate kinase [Cellulosilyticum sp.]|nr:glycerate kinase [Cellulosilyticum sp.]
MQPLKFVLAPDSFKESMSAKEVCDAMEKGIKRVFTDAVCVRVPMADGGEGTLEALVDATGGKKMTRYVTGPLGEMIEASYAILGDGKTAVIEMAKAAGLEIVPIDKRNPLYTTTYGVGELIKAALDQGVKQLVIAIGGSATNDVGVGMLQALGASFKDKNGREVGFGGAEVGRIETIDLTNFDSRLKMIGIEVACDVTNPLTGPTGASYIFAKQKGADKEEIKQLDEALSHFAKLVKRELGIEIDKIKGAGAAGGLGAGLVGFCNGKLMPGVDLVVKYSGLEKKVVGANFIFTGEGSIDRQTQYGKTLTGVAKVAKANQIPVIALAGRVVTPIDELYKLGISAAFSITPEAIPLEKALVSSKVNMIVAVENICRLLQLYEK